MRIRDDDSATLSLEKKELLRYFLCVGYSDNGSTVHISLPLLSNQNNVRIDKFDSFTATFLLNESLLCKYRLSTSFLLEKSSQILSRCLSVCGQFP